MNNKLDVVRKRMAELGVDAYIVPSEDPHLSEYPPEEWKLRQYISGFTGSAGTLVVLSDEAGLWTDSRYYLQAATQLSGSGITLFKDGLSDTPSFLNWIAGKLSKGNVVGFDGSCFSARNVESYRSFFEDYGILVVSDLSPLWDEGVPRKRTSLYSLPVEITGLSHREKREMIFSKTDADALLLCALDEVAWTLNIRAADTPYNPVAVAYAVVGRERTVLFAEEQCVSASLRKSLAEQSIDLKPYDSVFSYVASLPKDFTLSVDPSKTNSTLAEWIACRKVVETSPVALLKACKNDTELSGFRLAMRKDGVALSNAFSELYERIGEGERLTEMDVADILFRHRYGQQDFVCESFSTIAGYAAHGAVVHYSATEESNAVIGKDGLLLVDSGGNYLHGTTDITRTVCFGTPTTEQRRDYTLVLKGHIAVAMAHFPEGTQGAQLDVLAKMPLWRAGADYGHGTGHGVGHFLCVHEGPQNIRKVQNGVSLLPGMVLSDEPGVYREGKHGIRIENLVAVAEGERSEFGRFLRFETLTLFPYDAGLIDVGLLTDEELNWVNEYHKRVWETLSPAIFDKKTLKWLGKMTSVIGR